MAETPPEDLLEWLLREEEILGAEAVGRAAVDIEEARKLLKAELHDDPTDAQLTGFQQAGLLAYEKMPQVGIHYERVWHPKGLYHEAAHRDIMTGRFVKAEDVWSALAKL